MYSEDFAVLVLSHIAASGFYLFVDQTLAVSTHLFSRYFTNTIEIKVCDDQSHVASWLQKFIMCRCKGNVRHFRITNDIYDSKSRTAYPKDTSLDIKKQMEPLPTNWNVFFWYKRTYIRVVRTTPEFSYSMTETFKITAFGTRSNQILLDMIDEARKMAEEKVEKQVNFYRANAALSAWNFIRQVQPRLLSSIILREGVSKSIQEDLEDFLKNRKWYTERGIPYRRGYLLYGPPGCGKTSFVKAISGHIGYNIYEAQLSDRELTDRNLNVLITRFGRKSILLFEDVDAVFMSRPQDEDRAGENDAVSGKLDIRESKSLITFSGLLNAIDGVASEEDYIVFMTTNHIEKLDAALIRPGRIDIKQLIDYPDEKQIETFFKEFYRDCNDDTAEKFAKAVKDLKCNLSIAQIQGLLLKHKNNPEGNLSDVKLLLEACKENADPSHRNFYV